MRKTIKDRATNLATLAAFIVQRSVSHKALPSHMPEPTQTVAWKIEELGKLARGETSQETRAHSR